MHYATRDQDAMAIHSDMAGARVPVYWRARESKRNPNRCSRNALEKALSC
jgi:hypothetical protein